MNNSVKQRLHSGAVSSRIHFIPNALFCLKQIDLQSIFRKHLNVTQHSSSQLYIVGCKISFLFEVSYEYIHIMIFFSVLMLTMEHLQADSPWMGHPQVFTLIILTFGEMNDKPFLHVILQSRLAKLSAYV